MSALGVALHPVRLPLVTPLTTAAGTVAVREGVVLGLDDGEHTGWGEAMPMPGWSHESAGEVRAALDGTATTVATFDGAADPRFDRLLADLERLPTARAAVAGARADLSARRAGRPLAATLRETATTEVTVNALVADPSPDVVGAAVANHVASGMTSVKVKVAGAYSTVDLDVARVAAARRAGGPDLELRIDANGGWDGATAIEALRRMVVHDVAFCEEPVAGVAALCEVAARAVVPVAIDESARTEEDLTAALDAGIRVVVVKPQALGGPDIAMRVIDRVTGAGAEVVVTTLVDSAVGVAHAAHVAAASGSTLAHGLATSTLLARDIAPPLTVEAGRLRLSAGAGIGPAPGFAGPPPAP